MFTDEWSGQRQSAAIVAGRGRGQPVDQGGDPERAGEGAGQVELAVLGGDSASVRGAASPPARPIGTWTNSTQRQET